MAAFRKEKKMNREEEWSYWGKITEVYNQLRMEGEGGGGKII
jgi:hypothetical protein